MRYFTEGSVQGSQTPRIFLQAQHRIGSFKDQCLDLCATGDFYLDEWQQLILDEMLAYRDVWYYNAVLDKDMPTFAAREVGVVVTRQNGKAQDLDTPILTTEGWTTFRHIRRGQEVYGSDGQPTAVLAVTPVFTDEDCYRVSFSDGTSTVVSSEHLWHVRSKDARRGGYADLTTSYLSTRVGGVRPGNGRMEYNWRVRCDVQVDTPAADLPVEPWLFGYWLGDGDSDGPSLTVGYADAAWLSGELTSRGVSVSSAYDNGHGLHWRLADTGKFSRSGISSRLRTLGVLGDKHIPEVYLTASIDQRKALLAGLMDSDGFIGLNTKSNQVELCSSHPRLADGIHRLLRSLGVRVTPRIGRTSLHGERKKDRTRFLWTPYFNPFTMPRKAERWAEPHSVSAREMSITAIDRVPTVPVRCITVEADDGVYLTGHHFTPTHNSAANEARCLAGLFLLGSPLTIYSAHEFKTANEVFQRLAAMIERAPKLKRYVRRIKDGHGEQGIYLLNGQRLLFMTRTGSGGRGFTAGDVILDEAMSGLSEETISAILPTMTAMPNAQLIYSGSAGKKESDQLAAVRVRGMEGSRLDERLSYLEWSIDECDDQCLKDGACRDGVHDRQGIANELELSPEELRRAESELVESYCKSNPALGIRISLESLETDRRAMPAGKFAREHLGVGDWPGAGSTWTVIGEKAWHSRAVELSQPQSPLVFALDVAPNGASAAICVAGYTGEKIAVEGTDEEVKQVHVEITSDADDRHQPYDHRSGTSWVFKRIMYLCERYAPAALVLDAGAEAGALVPDIEKGLKELKERKGIDVELKKPVLREICQSASAFMNGVVPRPGNTPYIVHLDQPMLNTAVAGATKRELSDLWKWSRRDALTDISPLVAASLANWALHLKDIEEKAKPVEMWMFTR